MTATTKNISPETLAAAEAGQQAALDAKDAKRKTTPAKPGKAAAKTPAKPAPKTAAQTVEQVLARPAPPAAPATALNIGGLTDIALNLFHVLAASDGPVSGSTYSPAVAFSLQSLAKRGLAHLATHNGTDKLYVLTERGAALAALLWDAPEDKPAKPAAARKPRTPRKTAAVVTAK